MNLSEINREIRNKIKKEESDSLKEESAKQNPFEQFIDWFSEVLKSEEYDPSVMVLATIDENGWPDTRTVLLKELLDNQFIFYTNYDSKKGRQLSQHPVAAINFYWPNYSRQVRIRGRVEKVARNQSESYFSTRPREAKLGVHAWIQSSIVSSRDELDNKLKSVEKKFSDDVIPCPENWGGYTLTPFEYEFFQGRNWRMHDRLLYVLSDSVWKRMRLAP